MNTLITRTIQSFSPSDCPEALRRVVDKVDQHLQQDIAPINDSETAQLLFWTAVQNYAQYAQRAINKVDVGAGSERARGGGTS